jgi:hypothetical protein
VDLRRLREFRAFLLVLSVQVLCRAGAVCKSVDKAVSEGVDVFSSRIE